MQGERRGQYAYGGNKSMAVQLLLIRRLVGPFSKG